MYRDKYMKYKRKYLKLKRSESDDYQFTNKELEYIDAKIKGFVHCTNIDDLKKIIIDGYIKSPSLLNEEPFNDPSPYVVFTNIWFTKDQYPGDVWGVDSVIADINDACLIISKDILFDKNAYYYIDPTGDYGSILSNTILGANIKKILNSENMNESIQKLDVDENLKKGLLHMVPELDESKSYKNFLANILLPEEEIESGIMQNSILNLEKKANPFNEVCFLDKIDIKKYLIGVYTWCENVDEISKIIPRDKIICRKYKKL